MHYNIGMWAYHTKKEGCSVLTNAQKDHIVILKQNEQKSNTEIARLVGVSRGSVINLLKTDWTVNKQFLDDYNKNEQKNNEELLDMIKSIRYKGIVSDGLSMFTKENMQLEFDNRGLRSIIALVGNSFDKGMAYERLELDKRKTNIQEKTLELKVQELQARLDNPEAFHSVTIINDAPKDKEDKPNVYN